MAVRVPVAEGRAVVQAAPRALQRPVNDGGGQAITQAVQRFGNTMGAVAQQWDARLEKIDEASVMEMDTSFGDWERDRLRGENGYLRAQGKNAMDGLDGVVSEFDDRQRGQLEGVENQRQRQMLERVQAQRRERFLDQVQGHVAVQTEKYWDDSFTARAASISNDIAVNPEGDDRIPQMMALRDMYADFGQRKGWDADMIQAAQRDAFTNVHKASVAALLEAGDPTKAKTYLDNWAPQIEAGALTQLRGVVREQVDLFEADAFANGEAGAGPSLPTVPGNPAGPAGEPPRAAAPFTLRPPVAAASGSGFGPRRRPGPGASTNHGGVDYPVPPRTPVAAAGPGRVTFAGTRGGYGNMVIIDHGGGYETRYAHLSSVDVAVGDTVEGGRSIALSGGTRGAAGSGNSTGPHLHFETRRNGQAVDPDGQVGHAQVQGAGGGGARREAVPQPRTLEDAYEAADKAAGDGADWRRRETFRRAFASRYQRDQSFQADRERQAADAVSAYLPHGANAVSSYTAIPLRIRQGLSPQQDLAVRTSFDNLANGGGQTDYTTLNSLLDLQAYDPATFNAVDLTTYASKLDTGDMNRMLAAQRSTRTAVTPQNQTVRGVAQTALSNTDGTVTRLLTSIHRNKDERARAQIRGYVLAASEAFVRANDGRAPSEEQVVGMFMQGMREFDVVNAETGDRERRRAFERQTGDEAYIVIPRNDRNDIVARLRRAPYNIQNPTNQQLDDFYRRGLQEGLYRPRGVN